MSNEAYVIPQLDWQDFGDGRWRGCVNGRRMYCVTVSTGRGVVWWRYEDAVEMARRVDTLETAKALCQIDFEKQTAGLLKPAPTVPPSNSTEKRVKND